MRYKIAVGRPVTNGNHRHEVGSFLSHVTQQIYDPKSTVCQYIDEWYNIPCQMFPTDTARNMLVDMAQKLSCDFLFMVDDDAAPDHNFFETAFHFLRENEPAVIASPYVGQQGDVQVFEFSTTQAQPEPLDSWALTHIDRADASRRKGIQRIASIGTHLIAFNLKVFDQIKRPYFAYGYSDESHTKVSETEDCFAVRHLFNAGIPIYCDWDHWSAHWKTVMLEVPAPLTLDTIPEFFLTRAAEYLLYTEDGQKKLKEVQDKPRNYEGQQIVSVPTPDQNANH